MVEVARKERGNTYQREGKGKRHTKLEKKTERRRRKREIKQRRERNRKVYTGIKGDNINAGERNRGSDAKRKDRYGKKEYRSETKRRF